MMEDEFAHSYGMNRDHNRTLNGFWPWSLWSIHLTLPVNSVTKCTSFIFKYKTFVISKLSKLKLLMNRFISHSHCWVGGPAVFVLFYFFTKIFLPVPGQRGTRYWCIVITVQIKERKVHRPKSERVQCNCWRMLDRFSRQDLFSSKEQHHDTSVSFWHFFTP